MNAPMNNFAGGRQARGLRHGQSSQGSVLIIVMVVCIGLVSVALYFAHSTAMAYRGSTSDLAGREAQRAIDGAAQYVESLMITSATNNASSGSSTPSASTATSGSTPPMNLVPTATSYRAGAVAVGDATFWIIGDPETTSSGSNAANGTNTSSNIPTFGLVDEASKLNINTASATMLENLPNMTPSLAQAIVAWRTSGTASSGSTSTTSASSFSGVAKGGPFESIYELAQVAQADGDDPSILYGNDPNLNHILDNSESQGAAQFTPGIYQYVTVFSREPNTIATTGQSRINIVTGSAAVSSGTTETNTNLGESSSSTTPTTTRALLTSMFGATRGRELMDNVTIAAASRGGSGPVNSVLAFYIDSKMTAAELDQITPYLTMNTGQYKKGLINVNTASATVLACVPGITPDLATQIISARQGQTTPSTNLAWLVPILGAKAALQAGPYLTTESFQVTADVAAVGPNGLGYRRTLFVMDGSNGTPQIVYRRDMTPLGWALGPNALQSVEKLKVTTP